MLIVNPNLTVHGTRYLVLGIPNTEYSVPSTVGLVLAVLADLGLIGRGAKRRK